MRVYIAGKITGLDFHVAAAKFNSAAFVLRQHGHTPLSPTEMFPMNPVWDWAEYMLADLRIIFNNADALLMLDNWKDSKGATLEHAAAIASGKRIFYALDEVPKG